MNTDKKGEETGRESNSSMGSASARADTTNNKSTICVQSGLNIIISMALELEHKLFIVA